jgi:hypothetical protein
MDDLFLVTQGGRADRTGFEERTVDGFTCLVFAAAFTLLGTATRFCPRGFARLQDLALWITVAGACLPPLVFTLVSFRKSADAAIWFGLGLLTSLGGAAAGYLVGLFLPTSWSYWANLSVGLIPWTIVIAVGYVLKSR